MTKAQILDIQSGGDTRALTVDRVGICGIRLPMNFDEGGRSHPSVGEWKCYTDLSAQSRGTHMSRLVRALHDACEGFSYDTFRALPEKVIQRLSDASRCELSVNFDCFIEKTRAGFGGSRLYRLSDRFLCPPKPDGKTISHSCDNAGDKFMPLLQSHL